MVDLVSAVLVAGSLCLAAAIALLAAEIAAAAVRRTAAPVVADGSAGAGRLAVLIPAHNESAGLLPTLADVKVQLRSTDTLLVVADNCTDDTAAIASNAGAVVSRRDDPERRGKGYALAWGIRHLLQDPPDIVIILDADCRLGAGALTALADACTRSNGPVQALDLMVAPPGAALSYRVMEFTWRIKNWARPLGLKAMGLPCQLMGTGMAFPWDVIRSANLASGSIVEDLKLGLELAAMRKPPLFCPAALVTSEFPHTAQGVQSQRQRWEQGHIGLIRSAIPGLLLTAVRQRNIPLLLLALDAAIPPLALLGALAVASLAVTGIAALLGVPITAFLISGVSFAVLAGTIVLCWVSFGRDIIPSRQILGIGAFALRKVPLYYRLLTGKSVRHWVRTERQKDQ